MARPRTNAAGAPSLRVRDFLALVHDGVTARLGPDLDGLQWRQRFSYVQYYRGSPDVHFEVWAQKKTSRLEIGLHFEGERDANYAAAELLAMRAPDIQAAAGPEYELEEWTKVWTRLHHSFDARSLTPELAEHAADRVVALIHGIEPILDELGLRRARGNQC